MNGFAELLPMRDKGVAMHRRVAGDDSALHQYGYIRGDDGADASLGELALPIDARLSERAVFVVETSRNARAEDPVFDLEITEAQRRKYDVLVHAVSLRLRCQP